MPSTITTSSSEESYSPLVACVFIFNLIVGTGALTMPAAFADAGWVLSLISVFLISLISYATVTFIIEGMSIANALLKSDRHVQINSKLASRSSSETDFPIKLQKSEHAEENAPLISNRNHDNDSNQSNRFESDLEIDSNSHFFDINEKVELGHMAAMFFTRRGLNMFYACIALYLYGDLAIYAAAISKSVRDMICTYDNCSQPVLVGSDLCWQDYDYLDRSSVYRILIVTVACILGPFTFFNVQKTKYLQMFTSILRWLSFTSMIVLCFVAIFQNRNQGHPQKANIFNIPSLFGVCVYSFMCHHSLPSLITPINDKRNIYFRIALVYLLILTFYYLLSFTGIFTFPVLEDVFTLNFQKERCSANETHTAIVPEVEFFEYFLPLFPVFTLATSFPIIAITLTNNLRALLFSRLFNTSTLSIRMRFIVNQLCFPLMALIPPILIALATENLETLVGFVGSYAGTGIQYVIPACLVYYGRNKLMQIDSSASPMSQYLNLSSNNVYKQRFESPFRHRFWIYFVLGWATLCIIFVTINHITNFTTSN